MILQGTGTERHGGPVDDVDESAPLLDSVDHPASLPFTSNFWGNNPSPNLDIQLIFAQDTFICHQEMESLKNRKPNYNEQEKK